MTPLAPLRDLASHEEQLFARMSEHVSVKQPQVGKSLPEVARHLVEQRPLAVHDLVVREGQNKVFTERINHAECQRAVLVFAMDRVLREVAQGVVHPAHVPLEAEPQASQVSRPRHTRPARRFLGDRQNARVFAMAEFIEPFEEIDRFEVFVAAVNVGDPLTGFARVVEIDHRGHGVDSQSVDVVTIEPEKRIPQQEVADLGAAVVEDLGAPIAMFS